MKWFWILLFTLLIVMVVVDVLVPAIWGTEINRFTAAYTAIMTTLLFFRIIFKEYRG